MATIANLQTLVTANTSNFERNLKRAENQSASFIKSVNAMRMVMSGAATGFGLNKISSAIVGVLDSMDDIGKRLGTTKLGEDATKAAESWNGLKDTWRQAADVLLAQLAPAIVTATKELTSMMSAQQLATMQKQDAPLRAATTIEDQIKAQQDRRDAAIGMLESTFAEMQKPDSVLDTVWGMAVRAIGGTDKLHQQIQAMEAARRERDAAEMMIKRLTQNKGETTAAERKKEAETKPAAKLFGGIKGVTDALGEGAAGFMKFAQAGGQALDDVAAKAQKHAAMWEQFGKSIEDTLAEVETPLEAFQKRLDELTELRAKDLISEDVFNRARGMAMQRLDDATQDGEIQKPVAIAALEKGTAAAFAAERQMTDPKDKTQKDILEQAKRSAAIQERQLKALEDNKAGVVAFPKR